MNPHRDKGKGRPALDLLWTVIFEEQGGKTRLTIRPRLESAAVRDAMLKTGMEQGRSQSLDRLADLLRKL